MSVEPGECRICHQGVAIGDGLEDDGDSCCHLCRITELEQQLETVETVFGEGKRAAEDYYEQGQQGTIPTPYTDELRNHWWTRGFAYTARLHRAINAEIRVKELTNVITLDLPDAEWLKQFEPQDLTDKEWLDGLDASMRMCGHCEHLVRDTAENEHDCHSVACGVFPSPAAAKGLQVVLEDAISSGRYVNASAVLQPVLDQLKRGLTSSS
jgi:hypothetical protein